jgi:hypothetical protein
MKTPKSALKLLMVDSGAFAVWTRQKEINFREYLMFCLDHPYCDHYVSLDVIPGIPNKSSSKTPTMIEEACQQGWKNYQTMIEVLPKEKIIPVFHQGDDIKWLHRYVDCGTPYIGISPANDRTTKQRRDWLTKNPLGGRSVKSVITDSRGNPIVKTHGFAVTALALMLPEVFPWTSVDSATWGLTAGHGWIMIPKWEDGKWNYRKEPWRLSVSDTSPFRKKGVHVENISRNGEVEEYFRRFLKDHGIEMGSSEERKAEPGTKLQRGKERWASRKKEKLVYVHSKGLATDDQVRKAVNIRYFQNTARELGIKIYIAGFGMTPKVERIIEYRLTSYFDISQSDAIYNESFLLHYIRRRNESKQRGISGEA